MAKTTKIAAGLAAIGAAAAAGYYFYGSATAKKHRQAAIKWTEGMKKEVIQKAAELKKLTPKEFAKIVDTVAKSYEKKKAIKKVVKRVRTAAKKRP